MSTLLQTRKASILAAIDAMPAKFNPHRNRLELVTRAFLEHPRLFADAVRFEWTDRELFAVDPARCFGRHDRAGLVAGIALSSLTVPKLRSIEADAARIECGDRGARSMLRQPRIATRHLGVEWWLSPELGGRLPETSAQEIAA